jgi:hypothetical protein
MKKILSMVVVLTFLLILSPVVTSIADEADGFRGMNWGAPISEIRKSKKLVMRQDDGRDRFVFYSIVNDNLRFGGVNATSIRYFFWRDKFAGVVIFTTGKLDFDVLKVATEEKFGLGMTGIGPSGEEINGWDGELTAAALSYDTTTGKGKLVLFSKMMNELKEELEAEKTGKTTERDF